MENEELYEQLKQFNVSKEVADKLNLTITNFDENNNRLEFVVKNIPEIKEQLDKQGIIYKESEGKLIVSGKIRKENGYELPDTKENRALLSQNDIDFFEKQGNSQNKLFINGKKAALLMGMSFVIAPVPSILLFAVLNKTGVLNRILDPEITKEQKQKLEEGHAVLVTKGKEKLVYQKDTDTNQLMKINVNDIRIPDKVNGIELSPIQKERLKNLETLKSTDRLGNDILYRINLNEKSGIGTFYKNQVEVKPIPNINSDDKEKLDYISKRGIQGIMDIYGNKNNMRRDEFLDKYSLSRDFKEVLSIKETIEMKKNNGLKSEVNNLYKSMLRVDDSIKQRSAMEINNSKKVSIKI